MADRPVIIGGCPRSGTTLLRTMLNSHPELAVPLETRFLLEAWRRRLGFGDLTDPDNRRRLAEWIFHRQVARPGHLEVAPTTGVQRLVQAPPTLGSLLGTCFQLYAEHHGKRRWGDKRPWYIRHLGVITALFPDVQIVDVVRDPRAVVASLHRLGWRDVPGAVVQWACAIRAADRWEHHLGPDQLLRIRYEDLVAEPEGTLTRLMTYLELDAGHLAAMLAFHQRPDVVHSAPIRIPKHHWRLSEPLTAEPVRSWERELTREEIALVEQVTARAMRRLGYEPVAQGVRVPSQLRAAWRRRQVEETVKRTKWVLGEAHRRIAYRHPVAQIPRRRP